MSISRPEDVRKKTDVERDRGVGVATHAYLQVTVTGADRGQARETMEIATGHERSRTWGEIYKHAANSS